MRETRRFQHAGMTWALALLAGAGCGYRPTLDTKPEPAPRIATQALVVQPGNGAVVNDPGCYTNVLPPNDDGSTGPVVLPNPLDFFGTTYTHLYINNNGNVTFGQWMSTYTPFTINAATPPMIAPFFADVDTRGAGSSPVSYSFGSIAFAGRPAFCVNWVNVGYYGYHTDKLNSFQLLLVDRADTGAGDFDIVMNYDSIQWETGDASGGYNGFGGTSAGAGYSAGNGNASQFYQFPGSLVHGAFLDTNAVTGLINTSRNSLVPGRHVFPVRNGAAPVGGAIGGRVTDGASPAQGVADAPFQICPAAGATPCVFISFTGAGGQFNATGLAAGDYLLRAFPPASRSDLGPSTRNVTVAQGQALNVDVPLVRLATGIPPNVAIGPVRGGGAAQQPILYWGDAIHLSMTGCVGGTASYAVTSLEGGGVFATGPMAENPAGTYGATIAPFYPRHGQVDVSMTLTCPDQTTQTADFTAYIDPSGTVRDAAGNPVSGATVTLFRSDASTGPFDAVPNGSAVMSPANRVNPGVTDASGRFGWDVVAGFYKVRAEKAGCTSLTGDAFTESAVLTIPPATTGLDLRLNCPQPDRARPICNVTAVLAGPPKLVKIVVQDTGSGLQSVAVVTSTNASTVVAPFTVGTTSPVLVTSTKLNQALGSQIALRVTDVAGNVVDCDPMVAGEVPGPSAGGCSQGGGGIFALLGVIAAGVVRRRRHA